MVPEVHESQNVEMIRDGGSFAATFSDIAGHRHILFLQVHLDFEGGEIRSKHHLPPVLIDCDPSRRSADFGELSGPRMAISWEQAQALLRTFAIRTPVEGDPTRSLFFEEWLQEMIAVVDRDGVSATEEGKS